MLGFLARFNKATVATLVAFIAQLLANYLGWQVPQELQAGVVAVIVGLGVAAGPANKPEPGTALVEVRNLTATAKAEVLEKAEDTGKGLPAAGSAPGSKVQTPAWVMLLALGLTLLSLPGCDTLRQISGEPATVTVCDDAGGNCVEVEPPENAEIGLLRAALLFDGVLDAIDAASEPGGLIVQGTPLAVRIGDAVGAATDALEVAQAAVTGNLSTVETAVLAAMAAVERAALIFAKAKTGG